MANVYDNIINGSFDAVGAPPSYITPAYRAEDYASIYAKPATPTYQTGMLGRGLPYQDPSRLLPDSKKLPSTLPDGYLWPPTLTEPERLRLSRQVVSGNALMAQYNPDGTPKPAPATPSVGVPNATPATWNRIDQAAYDARNKRGTWLDQSRMQAQALMRQMAALPGGMPMAPGAAPATAPARGGGLAALITGTATPRARTGGLVALLGGTPAPKKATGTSSNGYVYDNGVRVGKDPQYAGLSPSQMYDAINRKSGNSSSSGNRLGEYLGAS